MLKHIAEFLNVTQNGEFQSLSRLDGPLTNRQGLEVPSYVLGALTVSENMAVPIVTAASSGKGSVHIAEHGPPPPPPVMSCTVIETPFDAPGRLLMVYAAPGIGRHSGIRQDAESAINHRRDRDRTPL